MGTSVTANPGSGGAKFAAETLETDVNYPISWGCRVADVVSGVLNKTDNTAGDVIAAQGAGVKIAVMSITVVNAHATVGTKVSIRAATTEKFKAGYCAALGGGVSKDPQTPLFVTGANEAVTAICATTGADVDISISGYKVTA